MSSGKSSFVAFTSEPHSSIMLQCDPNTLTLMAHSAAMLVLDFCHSHHEEFGTHSGIEGAMGGLDKYLGDRRGRDYEMQRVMATNSVLAQVQLLYTLVKLKVEKPDAFIFVLKRGSYDLVADALRAFQKWKTACHKAEQAEHGPNWGTALSYNTVDWTDLNEKFLSLR